LMPGFKKLRVRRQPLRMLVTKNQVDFRVDQLSDGEKGVLALAGDLAKRLAIANPGAKSALKGEAIVLIDEIELHLHPAWQRKMVRALQTTFPNCQFIVTSHSPQVVSEVEPAGVFLLSDGEISRPIRTKGRDSGLILRELMEASARPEWAQAAIEHVYELLDDEETEKARTAFLDLADIVGDDDPALATAKRVLQSRRRETA
jgi:predicted ATP-binding protein involved in virulence